MSSLKECCTGTFLSLKVQTVFACTLQMQIHPERKVQKSPQGPILSLKRVFRYTMREMCPFITFICRKLKNKTPRQGVWSQCLSQKPFKIINNRRRYDCFSLSKERALSSSPWTLQCPMLSCFPCCAPPASAHGGQCNHLMTQTRCSRARNCADSRFSGRGRGTAAVNGSTLKRLSWKT